MTSQQQTRLVLGFDAGCMACSKIAEEVTRVSNGRLEVLSLASEQMVEWRRTAFGPNPPWTPTLIDVTDDEVSARTGAGMGLALVRTLGVGGSWRVAQALGELRRESAANARGPMSSVTRSGFLKGAVGVALGVTILAGTSTPASAASKLSKRNQHWFDALRSESKEELSADAAQSAWLESLDTDHVSKLFALKSVQHENSAQWASARSVTGLAVDEEITSGPGVKGCLHKLVGGGTMTALVFSNDDMLIASYTVTDKNGFVRRLTREYKLIGDLKTRLIAEADDGVATDVQAQIAAQSNDINLMANGCGDCMYSRCDETDWLCAKNCCAGCIFACLNPATCIGCMLILCAWCSSDCCNRYGCYPIVRCGPY